MHSHYFLNIGKLAEIYLNFFAKLNGTIIAQTIIAAVNFLGKAFNLIELQAHAFLQSAFDQTGFNNDVASEITEFSP